MLRRTALILFIALMFCGCAIPAYLSGRINTAAFSMPTGNRVFTMVLPDSPTLRDRRIGELISERLVQRGYRAESSGQEANTAVLYKFSIGQGQVFVSSSFNYTTGGTNVSSSTEYPRFFQLTIIDIEESKSAGKPILIWQGEVYSSGPSTNTAKLAEHFLDVLFENFGENVNEKSFHRIIMW